MQAVIQYIEKELEGKYSKREIGGFTRLIFEQVCNLSYTSTLIHRDRILERRERTEIEKIVERLKSYEPIQYILGNTEFSGLLLHVKSGVLIPRPETEELVQWIVETNSYQTPAILDIGTGSGCIGLALKKAISGANVYVTDVSKDALEVARENANLNGLNVNFFDTDILLWENYKWGKYDIIVSNPPYVRESEKKDMEPNVLNYEPESALFVPDSYPLMFYRRIGEFALNLLEKNGSLFFEINENLGDELISLLSDLGFSNLQIKKDLNNKERMLWCRFK